MSLGSISLAVLVAAGAPSSPTVQEFSPGQVWTYATRPNETASTLTVVKIDRPKGEPPIIVVAVVGLRVRFRASPNGPYVIRTQLQAMPFSEEALRQSVKALVRVDTQLPDYQGEYTDWLLLGGDVYKVSVAEAVAQVERGFNP